MTRRRPGIVYHRVPLAEINWTGRRNTDISGTIEDCRKRFRPLTNQKICCTFLIGDGVSSFGDFNSLEEAAAHLPPAGGELCLLPGLHRANSAARWPPQRHDSRLRAAQRWCCRATETRSTANPPFRRLRRHPRPRPGSASPTTALRSLVEGRQEGSCRDVRIHDTRMIARDPTHPRHQRRRAA